MTRQAYRFGDDYYKPSNDMIKLESARCPLKEQNEGYLMHLLTTYWKDSARVLKFENKGEIENGEFKFSKSRAHDKYVFFLFLSCNFDYSFQSRKLRRRSWHRNRQ